MGLIGIGAPVTLPGPPLLICTLPATFPVPWELALLLMVTAPGTMGGAELAAPAWGTFTPVPIVPCPWITPPPVRLELSAVLAVPDGPGVGVGTTIARPEPVVWPEAALNPNPARRAATKTRIENLMGRMLDADRNAKPAPVQPRRSGKVRPAGFEPTTGGLESRGFTL
jgi:hypothetical protein